MPKHVATPENIEAVFEKLVFLCNEDDTFAEHFCRDFNALLDEQVDQDMYGTEAQNDPRGDQRD